MESEYNMPNLHDNYTKTVTPALGAKFGYANVMAVPKITKVVVHVGVGRMRDDKQRAEVEKYLMLITGQKAAPRAAKKAIASFKTRKGLIIGYQVTLRGTRMYDFLSRLIDTGLPRTRDFRGLGEGSFDKNGNLTIGIKEHIIFPEMIGEDYHTLFGFEVTVVTTAHTREEGVGLLRLMGFPLQNPESSA